MKKIIFLFVIFIGRQAFCQTNFAIGFNDGYKVGYCYDQGLGCIAPIPPVAPLCKIGESLNSYTDGYNRGLLVGTSAKTSKNQAKKTNSSTDVYGQPINIPQFEPFIPDYAFYEKTLRQNQINYEKNLLNIKTQQEKEKQQEIDNFIKDYMSPENVSRRVEYIKLLKQYYADLKWYPSSIPDGLYKVTTTTEPQPGYEKMKPSFSEGEALVKGNRIIILKTVSNVTGENSWKLSVNEYPVVKNDYGGMGITESYPISNGKVKLRASP